ncbi:MgtC/SapB family protein [Salipaludibacillus neizhouensis]|nr:MgtC/SapB family protein [Salipaludibacillus neizhouensis]
MFNEIFSNIIESFSNYSSMYLRILISGIIGFLIGLDRSSKQKPAGVKTYMYVSIACTLITLVSIYSVDKFSQPDMGTMMDPMRLAAQIVTGLGFLGAGVILKTGLHVKGLTSAAMILFAGGVGIGIGAGFYEIVFFAVFVSFILARFGNWLEKSKWLSEKDVED